MGILQALWCFVLVTAGAEAAAPRFLQSVIGSRAIFADATHLNYQPSSYLRAEDLSVSALDLDTGESFPFTFEGVTSAGWRLRAGIDAAALRDWVRRPLLLTVRDAAGHELDRTFFQFGALLDAIYKYDGCLGVCWEGGRATLRVWAPTARSVGVVFEGSGAARPMRPGPEGSWELSAEPGDRNRAYLYEVEVFTPSAGRFEHPRVTDPYSIALTENSKMSVLVHPDDWKPAGWDSHPRPPLAARTDAVLYELHVREFSAADESVPERLRGTYLAFAERESLGVKHLAELAQAGVTHVHLLPVNDFASVEESRAARREPALPASGLSPDSVLPQEEIQRFRAQDGWNWGYDPFHYLSPEGSYALQTNGGARLLEFREMVQALHRLGLRVVLDQVFNHTFASGLNPESVLDKIVPGYYYRLGADGSVRNSSCCSDTASERRMTEKLMRDALESWRSVFRVDGFRFDLMNLHGASTMVRLRDELRAKDPSLLLYGEAWPFGSLLERDPADAFTVGNAYGRSIGVFNDRLRDAARGGTTDHKEKSDQGFLTGLGYDFNREPANRNTPVDAAGQREKLLFLTDVVRVGLAGAQRDFRFRDRFGHVIRGGDLNFNGGPAGFAAGPEDVISYLSAHDGYTLFDALQAKLPFHAPGRERGTATAQERLERQILGMGLVALAQGTPFFDAGTELLRSKSGDQNSYDSGDWFNRLDWSLRSNGWGRGLPPAFGNRDDWPFWRPRLADPDLNVGAREIRAAKEAFLALLRLRKESPLLRLPTGAEINRRLSFLETEAGSATSPGLIVMQILDEAAGEDLDPRYRRLLAAYNVTNAPISFAHRSLRDARLERLFGSGAVAEGAGSLELPPRSLSVWGERP